MVWTVSRLWVSGWVEQRSDRAGFRKYTASKCRVHNSLGRARDRQSGVTAVHQHLGAGEPADAVAAPDVVRHCDV
ncbi:hypothetical protein J2S90_002502 [Arthrobacter bambusae]|jgi:hypothetical protein|uniref:Uncharacterized protein n=1 Tax=Arthrobacter bambusae TaxID=1338426 RepID=A0AAW8D9E4_9MICC|nr:hypothetical protein [Arthrobacter bambusae]MDQ0127387.1 hypothetical protein [Arthrobacter bambusae]MDQ0178729.1 hypothetical protein [Arthrobacter bambusae]